VEEKAKGHPTYAVSLADLEEYEKQWGRIPPRSIVAAATGWATERWSKGVGAYYNNGLFPGFSLPLVKFLVTERDICGIAIDTLSGDVGDQHKYPVHDYLLVEHSKFIIENCLFPADPAVLPPAGAIMLALPPRVKSAPEMIVRCVVLIEETTANM